MSTQTSNLHLTKQDGNENPSRTALNGNWDILDEAVSRVEFVGFKWVRYQYNNADYPFDIWACDQNDTIHLLRVRPSGLEYATIVNDTYTTVWLK